MKEVYQDFDTPSVKISFINEIANLYAIIGTNVKDVAQDMGFDNSIGNKFLNAGIGYKGSCLKKETQALNWLANFHEYELHTVKALIDVNKNKKLKLIKKSHKYYESLNIAVLGLGTADLC